MLFMKKGLSLILAVLLVFSCASIVGGGAEAPVGEFTAFCQNVAGLPDISFVFGDERTDVKNNQKVIGTFVSDHAYDIFATQEDFGYHDTLVEALPDYAYQTSHHGGVPYGDGTNVFTRSMPLYNEKHITWNSLYGIADDGADEFSQKGITYVCIEVADGVFVDFYNIHADAYGDEGSVAARQDNFRQLAQRINLRTVSRPVIVTGDFNAFVFNDNSLLKETLIDGCGLKDAWTELYNGGDYTDCSSFIESNGGVWTDKWGVWDSVERFLYKDGGGVTLTCTEFEYVWITDAQGRNCSDHAGAYAKFSYNAENAKESIGSDIKVVKPDPLTELVRRIVGFFKALILGIRNFDKVREYFNF